ncbi:MAG: hypothetical protein OXH04_23900 [Acidobacteria bacterium]|nr:hypothetical protein [Acidobacteriota bacterium]
MRAALTTAILIGLGGLGYATFLGFAASGSADLLRHTTVGIFATLVTLLAHSMTMFYLLGKGRAIREAAAEGGLPATFYAAVARARRPVFSVGMLAMGLTMAAAIIGAGVDTGAVPTAVHTLLGAAAIAANLALFRAELAAMQVASDTERDVNALLEPPPADG